MNHDRAIAVLLEQSRTGPDGALDEEVLEALSHVAMCSDCWEFLRSLHIDAFGDPPPQDAIMNELYGCEPVREEMYRLVDLAPAEIRTRHPRAARHLGWCASCRERFVELLAFMAAAESEEKRSAAAENEHLGVPRRFATAEQAMSEVAGRFVIALNDRMAAFVEIPSAVRVIDGPRPEPVRGEPLSATSRPIGPDRVVLPLGDTGLSAELGVSAQGEGRGALELLLHGSRSSCRVRLSRETSHSTELVAIRTLQPGSPEIIKGIPANEYVLEISRESPPETFRARIEVRRAT